MQLYVCLSHKILNISLKVFGLSMTKCGKSSSGIKTFAGHSPLWVLLAPRPPKRLVTQSSCGPRVWKLLIEEHSQPKWQAQGRFCVAPAICGGCRERPPPLGRTEAASRWNYTPLVAPLFSLCPDHLRQKANSLSVIFRMIHPSVHMDAALLFLPVHKHSASPLLRSTHYTRLNLNLWIQLCACSSVQCWNIFSIVPFGYI